MAKLPQDIIDLFRDMEYIASTPPGHKICPSKRTYDDARTLFGWFKRRVSSNGWEESIEFCKNTNRRVIENIRSKGEEKYYPLLLAKTERLKTGFLIIKDSYSDPKVKTQPVLELELIILDLNFTLGRDDGEKENPPE